MGYLEDLFEKRIESIQQKMDSDITHDEADKLLAELVEELGGLLNPFGREVIAEILVNYEKARMRDG